MADVTSGEQIKKTSNSSRNKIMFFIKHKLILEVYVD